MPPPPDAATAYHEAGHAVLALALAGRFTASAFCPTANGSVRANFARVYFDRRKIGSSEILIALGGIAAEAIHTGVYAWNEAERDLLYVRELTEQRAGRRQAERLERRLLAKAEHLLAKRGHWQAVELIAKELLRHGEISGRTARHLFDQECRKR